MFNISFMTCIKMVHWSQESRRPNSVWVEQVPSTFLFRNLTSGFKSLAKQIQPCLYILFWVECNQDKKPCNYLVDCNLDPKLCNFRISNYVYFYPINEKNNLVMYFVFSFFLIFFNKKISDDSIPLTQKEMCSKKHSKNLSFLRGTQILAVSHTNSCCDCTITILGILLQ